MSTKRNHNRRGEVIEIYENGMVAAIRLSSGRVECVRHNGTCPNGERVEFFIGQRGVARYSLTSNGHLWTFQAFKKQRGLSQ